MHQSFESPDPHSLGMSGIKGGLSLQILRWAGNAPEIMVFASQSRE